MRHAFLVIYNNFNINQSCFLLSNVPISLQTLFFSLVIRWLSIRRWYEWLPNLSLQPFNKLCCSYECWWRKSYSKRETSIEHHHVYWLWNIIVGYHYYAGDICCFQVSVLVNHSYVLSGAIYRSREGGGVVLNMLRVWVVCAAHLAGISIPKFSSKVTT